MARFCSAKRYLGLRAALRAVGLESGLRASYTPLPRRLAYASATAASARSTFRIGAIVEIACL